MVTAHFEERLLGLLLMSWGGKVETMRAHKDNHILVVVGGILVEFVIEIDALGLGVSVCRRGRIYADNFEGARHNKDQGTHTCVRVCSTYRRLS